MNLLGGLIDSDFVVMDSSKRASIEHLDEALYARLDAHYGDFAGHELISCHSFDCDWPTWEIHPHGDEIVMLLSGEATLVLQTPDGETSQTLARQGEYVVVPRNTWHTARTPNASKMLFITPGQGTQNKPLQSAK